MSIFILRSVFVYTRCTERTLVRIKQGCCVTQIHFAEGLFYKQTYALAVLLKRKYCLKFVYGFMGLWFIINCEFDISMFCSKFRIESNQSYKFFRTCIVCLLQSYWLFAKKLCYLLFSISVAIGQFSSNWPGWSSRTIKHARHCTTVL